MWRASQLLLDHCVAGLSGICDPSTQGEQMALAKMNVLAQKPKHWCLEHVSSWENQYVHSAHF